MSESLSEQVMMHQVIKDVVRRNKRTLLLLVLVGVIISLSVAYHLPDRYVSSALISINTGQSEGLGLSQLSSSLGRIASIAGMGGLVEGSSGDHEIIERMVSRQFVIGVIDRHEWQKELLASDSWRAQKNEIQINPKIFDVNNSVWKNKFSDPRFRTWSSYREFRKYFEIEMIKPGIYRVSFEHFSPVFAKYVVETVIAEFNIEYQSRVIERSEKNIEFLYSRLSETQLADMRSVIYSLIEEQTKTLMLSRGDVNFCIKTIDSPYVPYWKTKPNRKIIVISGVALTVFFALFYILVLALKPVDGKSLEEEV